MYYIECPECNKEVEQDLIYHCDNCCMDICRKCFLDGDGLCENCLIEEL